MTIRAYATVEEYNGPNNRTDEEDTDLLEGQLLFASRLFDRELGLAPGALLGPPDEEDEEPITLKLSGNGKARLPLRDIVGQWLVRSIDEIRLDLDRDGVYETVVDPSAALWLTLLPQNATAAEEGFDTLALRSLSGNTIGDVWPAGDLNIEVDVFPGCPARPDVAREVVIAMTRDMRDMHQAGPGYEDAMLANTSFSLASQTWRLIRSAKQQWSYRTARAVSGAAGSR